MNPALDPKNTYAILIGMTDFDGFDRIPPASRNVEDLALQLAATEVFGLPENRIRKITNLTSSEVKRLLNQYVLEAQKNRVKTLLFYYAGHGYRRTDGQYFLTASDSDPELINLDGSACIAYEGVVKKILKASRIPQVFVIIDACYSGVAAQNDEVNLPGLDLNVSYTLTSSAANEESFFNAEDDYTYFTAALLDFFRYGISNDKASLTLVELYDTLRNSIRKKGLKMSPQQSAGKQLQPHLYAICKNRAFDPIKLQVQEWELEIDQTIESIKRGRVKSSEVYFQNLKKEIEKGNIPDSNTRNRLLSRIEEQLTFCTWYLKYEKSILKDILNNTVQPKLDAKHGELDLRVREINELNEKLNESNAKLEKLGKLEKEISRPFLLDSNLIHPLRQNYLSTLISLVLDGHKRFKIEEEIERLESLLTNETLKILVVGEYNVGKSTFINALLSEKVLPSSAVSTTGIPHILKYGTIKGARLYFENQDKNPIDLPFEKLSDYVLTRHKVNENNARADYIPSHIEIWWPLNFLKDNKVEIIDSPGLNDIRSQVTLDYLLSVDAVVFLMSANRFGPAQTEMDCINALKSAEHFNLFFVINQWDMLRKHQIDEVKTSVLRNLSELNDYKEDIYFVSSLDALEGRIENNQELEQRSGFVDLEAKLSKFFLQARGYNMLIRKAREVRRIIQNSLTKVLPVQLVLIKREISQLTRTYESIQMELKQITNKEVKKKLQKILNETKENLNTKFDDMELFNATLEQMENDLGDFIDSILSTS